MFYEEFELFPDEDDPRAEYVTDDLKIWYYMPNMIEGIGDIIDTISHEWLHGMFDWATEGVYRKDYMVNGDADHFIMRLLNFD